MSPAVSFDYVGSDRMLRLLI